MCVLRFFKNLVLPKNWLLLLYLLLNIALGFALLVYVQEIDFSTDEDLIFTACYFGAYLLVLIILATPLGEGILRLTMHAKKLQRNEETKEIYEIFDEVYNLSLAKSPKISKKVKLYYFEDDSVNAFCLGSRTVIINTGLLTLPKECIKAIIAHEFGHIATQDSLTNLALIVSNWLIYFLVSIISFFVFIFFAIFDLLIFSALFKVEVNRFYIARFFKGLLMLVYKLWLEIGILLTLASSRKKEYKADEYARSLGYGASLAVALGHIDRDISLNASVLETIYATHPKTSKRILKLGYTPEEVQEFINELYSEEQEETVK